MRREVGKREKEVEESKRKAERMGRLVQEADLQAVRWEREFEEVKKEVEREKEETEKWRREVKKWKTEVKRLREEREKEEE